MTGTLKNDCFALPPGVDWTPVEDALARLNASLDTIAKAEVVSVSKALGRVLAEDVLAVRDHPAHRNSAVDGYAIAFRTHGLEAYDLIEGVAAAGTPLRGALNPGQAVRILTGAMVPEGTDAVVLQEESRISGDQVCFDAPPKPDANIRAAGEDAKAGNKVLPKGTRLNERDLAVVISVGISQLLCFKPLTIGVLSTGDEIVASGGAALSHQVYDANRPMLLGLLSRWGYELSDFGHVSDDADAVEAALRHGVATCDAILTSGGASAGDEDHISTVLGKFADRHTWRVAMKPGRPLALANWDGVPVFGLPGNPIAAYVCSLIFARPALRKLQGQTVTSPQSMELPAAFSKSKKPGRSEYPRARINTEGLVELFRSEGSGRVSGLAWADGLVEFGHAAETISKEDLVRYIPFSSFD